MTVRIEFLGMQRSITKTSAIDMPISEKTIVADVLEYVRGRYPDLPLDEKMILMIVNQGMTSPDTILKRNDTVSFLPAIGGG
jgi:molybdopterin converting factor small subunit